MTNRLLERGTFQVVSFLAISLIVAIAPLVNHIDDTDEIYGYWEPLHYLLFSRGMQTWEYSPEFALRSYAFLYPLFGIASLLRDIFGLQNKVILFYIFRGCIGFFTAFSQLIFLSALHYGMRDKDSKCSFNFLNRVTKIEWYVLLFLISSPGIFFASTAFLPSAQAMSLLCLTLAATIQEQFQLAILAGSIAVLWTGWPFVGLIFLPLGLYMLWRVLNDHGSFATFMFCLQALATVLITAAPAVFIDWFYYQRMTWPTLNILLYNTAGKGDELYGIEPVSYYIKNLCLLTGLAFPCALLLPLIRIFSWTFGGVKSRVNELPMSLLIAVYSSMMLWLGVLASRPHKEERFLYPVYPLLILIAAHTVVDCKHIVMNVFSIVSARLGQFGKRAYVAVLCITSMLLAVGRIRASHYNYGGYLHTWQELSQSLAASSEVSSFNVCLGSDWYRFPSHFFLPSNAHLLYFEDGFHGILPQPFAEFNGTFVIPLLPTNDRNAEEVSRYVSIFDCQVLVSSTSQMTKYQTILKAQGLTVEHIVGHEVLDSISQRDGSTKLQQLGRALRLPGLPPPPREQYFAGKVITLMKENSVNVV